jgi:predicted metalloprotease with PDZ domain
MTDDPIEYRICAAHPSAHLFEVECRVPDPDPEGQLLTLPAWIPGSYMIRDFARNIVSLQAFSAGRPTEVEKLDKQTWRCITGGTPLIVRYQVYAWELSVRGAYLDPTRGYFNGTSVFLRVEGKSGRPCVLDIEIPTAAGQESWQVATALPKQDVDSRGGGRYAASDYQQLIDCPVEMGRFERAEFPVGGAAHELIVSGRCRTDLGRIADDLSRICEQHRALFGELPLERYLFLTLAVGEGYGGLEHCTSCSLLCSRDDLPVAGDAQISEGYRRFLGLCSHEYFHLWNVKRIRPRILAEADLTREVHTRLLWVFEGITSYYDDLALIRSGLIDEKSYLELLAQNITRLFRGSGRYKQTLEESSFDAWTRFYKQDENAPNAIVSYYTKGALVALALDLLIRRETGSNRSLDDVMRALWRDYGKPDCVVGEDDVEKLAARVTGLDLGHFFDRVLRGTQDLPLAELLEGVGVGMRQRPARDSLDKGGFTNDGSQDAPSSPVLGLRLGSNGELPLVANVLDGGAARQAGISAGDRLVAIDGLRVTDKNLGGLLARLPGGAAVPVHLFRRDELLTLQVTPTPALADTCDLWLLPDADSSRIEARRSWLHSGVSPSRAG